MTASHPRNRPGRTAPFIPQTAVAAERRAETADGRPREAPSEEGRPAPGRTRWLVATGLSGLTLAAFYFYQIIDAVRSAHAIRAGLPAPDPFGLAKAFASGERVDFNKVPVGALVLIGLGVLFLLNTMGLFHAYWIHRLWPLILIAIGVWLFIKRFSPPRGATPQS